MNENKCDYITCRIEHDAEIRAKAIDEFANKMKWEYENSTGVPKKEIEFAKAIISMVTERMKGVQ